jgi:hypothetical protein
MKVVTLTALLLSLSASVFAQAPPTAVTINPATATMEFGYADFNTVLPPNDVLAGQPMTIGFQTIVFPAAADVGTGVPIATGAVIPKSVVTVANASTTPPTYRATFAQAGLVIGTGPNQIPPCTVVAPATCPAYTALLLAIGPNNRASPKAVLSESNPFMLAALVVTQPAPPTNVVVK